MQYKSPKKIYAIRYKFTTSKNRNRNRIFLLKCNNTIERSVIWKN